MAAFSSYDHPPFLIDSVLSPKAQAPIHGDDFLPLPIPNLNQFCPLSTGQICQEGSSVDASALESSCVEQQSTYYNEPSATEKQSTESLASMAESEQKITQNSVPVDNKRKIKNGSSSNSAHSKDVVKQVKSKKHKAEKENEAIKEVRNDKKDQNQATEEPPKGYIHVRARRGQATDSHSLAERVRREKISERMKTLQALVPGCDKVNGKALMLDEIINYVQSLQNQVEFLSMRLAALDPTVYTFGLMDLDALAFGFEGMNDTMTLPLPPLVQSSTTTSSTSGSTAPSFSFLDTNAIVSSTTATTTTTFPCPLVDSSTSLMQEEQKLLLPTHQEGRSSYWPWGVLDEEQRQSNIINQFGLGGNNNNLYSFH